MAIKYCSSFILSAFHGTNLCTMNTHMHACTYNPPPPPPSPHTHIHDFNYCPSQGSFTQEVDAPCARQKEVVDSLKADLSLLGDPEEAEKLFEEFEKFAQDVDDKKQKLEDALRWADRCVSLSSLPGWVVVDDVG